MGLKQRIDDDIKTAMKAKDKLRLETVRSIKKLILEKESSVRAQGQDSLSEDQEMELLLQLAKQRRDAVAQYQQGGREDLAAQEAQELIMIEAYLPQQLSDAELEAEIEALIAQVGATSAKDMGKVMGQAMQTLKGRADGKRVQEWVKAKLNG
ncbi:MAG: GatB/YqeY domain-containing protein [Synechococcaceae cyanobacterium SM2_3_1]|nr:GatB/YqeY domain-containing protein [Synechococcaceae cyanobacterium SM2_3_1]